jgi:DNA-binding transcriptional regulator PaaX
MSSSVREVTVTFMRQRDVTRATFGHVAANEKGARWLVLVVRVPAEPSRHRVAVWRELRRAGAVPLGQGCWAVPEVPAAADGVARAVALAGRGSGEVVALRAAGREETDAARLEQLFTEARQAEWAEFIADCGKFDAEIDSEIAKGKFTVAELEEEEQSVERLRRWHRELAVRDVFGAPNAAEAAQRLKHCAERLAEYTELVFRAVHQM